MVRPLLLWTALALGCSSSPADAPNADAASDASTSDASPPGDTTLADTGAADTATVDTGVYETDPDALIFPVEDLGVPTPGPTCGVPTGTKASSATVDGANVPANAIDGKNGTSCSSGKATGLLTLTFPKPTKFDRARIRARGLFGSPTATFTLTGKSGGKSVPIGTVKAATTLGGAWLPEVKLLPGTWDALDVAVSSSTSVPIPVDEVFLYDSGGTCPPPM